MQQRGREDTGAGVGGVAERPGDAGKSSPLVLKLSLPPMTQKLFRSLLKNIAHTVKWLYFKPEKAIQKASRKMQVRID